MRVELCRGGAIDRIQLGGDVIVRVSSHELGNSRGIELTPRYTELASQYLGGFENFVRE
jgi:hypothetical protein